MSFVNKRLKFLTYYMQKCYHFFAEKNLHNFSAKTLIDFVSTVRHNESSTNEFVMLSML